VIILISKEGSPKEDPPGPIRRTWLALNDPRSSQMIIIML